MFSPEQLVVPVMTAPMAGGPSTPELVAAVTNAGGSGFLAAGYKRVETLADEIERTRALTFGPFGVNVFVPASDLSRDDDTRAALAAYRVALEREASQYGVEIPESNPLDRDGWDGKIAYLISNRVPFVSFTFGCPDEETIARFRSVDTCVIVTVSDEEEALTATGRGANALCVQGPEAGGHRGTHHVEKCPDDRSLVPLLQAVSKVTDLSLMAAGGITRADHISAVLDAGAVAVQLGTIFLRTPESGASALHKDALASGKFIDTRVTRAFSGRWARGLINRFMEDHHDVAPAAYPEVNQWTRPLRAAVSSSGDADGMALWAGTGFRDAEAKPAAEVLSKLWQGVER